MNRADQIKGVLPLLLLVGLSVLGACALSGGQFVLALSRFVIDGGVVVLWAASAAGLGGAVAAGLRLSTPHPALRVGVSLGLGWGVLSLAQLGLGLAGCIGSAWAWGMLVPGWLLGAWLLKGRSPGATHERAPWGALAFVPLSALVLFLSLVPAGFLWKSEPNAYDVLAYHLQLPREWCELGRIVPLTHNVFSFMPLALEMHWLTAMQLMGGPWAGMYAAQMMHVAFFAAAALSAYGAFAAKGRAPAVLAALAIVGCPYVLMLAPIAYNEGGVVLYGTLVLALLLQDDLRLCHALAAALCAGFSAGVKLTAAPLWIVGPALMLLALPRGPKRALLFLLVATLAFSPWLARTAVWSHGNPVFPLLANQLGHAHFTPEQVGRFNAAHAPRPDQQSAGARVAEFAHQVLLASEFGYLLIPAALVAIALGFRSRPTIGLGILLVFQTCIWLFATHLQGRFFVPSLPVLAFLIARTHARWAAIPVALYALGFLLTRPELNTAFGGIAGLDPDGFFRQVITPEPLRDIPPDRTLTLVGDSTAYLYCRPTRLLKYTGAFDAVGPDARSAWRVSDGDLLWIDPFELDRLHRTYKTPEPPPEWRKDAPFLVTPRPFTSSRRAIP